MNSNLLPFVRQAFDLIQLKLIDFSTVDYSLLTQVLFRRELPPAYQLKEIKAVQ